MNTKRPSMSEEEENIQRALGTLPRFEVMVERTITKASFARVYVTAGNEEMAKKRALEFATQDSNADLEESESDVKIVDDTENPIAWADNQKGDTSDPTATGVREIKDDDYMAHRFKNKKMKMI